MNRQHFAAHGIAAINIVSSPGSGKTTVLCSTVAALSARAPTLPVAIIEGDQQTSLDADRLRATGAQAIQVNTGKGCHLDARMVAAAFERLPLHEHDYKHEHGNAHLYTSTQPDTLLLIENVGNLVCPALWDLGESARVVILSVAEGDDKPLKYPDMFASADLLLINKLDLLPWVDFSVERCVDHARRINSTCDVLSVSATSGQGLEQWLNWLLQPHQRGLPT